jgi:hypothetical protein
MQEYPWPLTVLNYFAEPNPNPILNKESIQHRNQIFLMQRFESETESEPNARNQIEPLDVPF